MYRMVDGSWGLSIRQQKNNIPTWFELQTIQHTVSHCAMYTVTPHHEHNEVNVNDKISDFHGGHILVSYTKWWLNNMVFWKDVLPTLSELWLAEFTQTSCISDIFFTFHHFVFFLNHSVRCRQYIHLKQIYCFVSVFSKVSGQVFSSVQKCVKKSIMVMFTSVVVFEGTVHTEIDLPLPKHCIPRQENLNMMSWLDTPPCCWILYWGQLTH